MCFVLRFEVVNNEYEEDLTLEVLSYVDEDKKNILYTKEIKGKKQFNSWFNFKFEEGIFLVEGTSCTIRVTLPLGVKADYQNITRGQISSGNNLKKTVNTLTFRMGNYVLEGENWDQVELKCADADSTACMIKKLHFTLI